MLGLGPYAAAIAVTLIAVCLAKRGQVAVAAVVIADLYATAGVQAITEGAWSLLAVGSVDFVAICVLAYIGGEKALAVGFLFACMLLAYIAAVAGAVATATMWGITEALALCQIVVIGAPDGMVMAGGRGVRWRIGRVYRRAMGTPYGRIAAGPAVRCGDVDSSARGHSSGDAA